MLRFPTLLPIKPSTPTTGLNPSRRSHGHLPKRLLASSTPPPAPPPRTPNPATAPKPLKPEPRAGTQNPEDLTADFPTTKPRKPRRGRRSEAAAVEDFVRGRLEQVFASIQERDPEVLQGKGEMLKPKEEEERVAGEEGPGEEDGEQKTVVEEEDTSWPLDADVGWGVRASEYFDKHSIKNVTVDGVEIDWEGEVDHYAARIRGREGVSVSDTVSDTDTAPIPYPYGFWPYRLINELKQFGYPTRYVLDTNKDTAQPN